MQGSFTVCGEKVPFTIVDYDAVDDSDRRVITLSVPDQSDVNAVAAAACKEYVPRIWFCDPDIRAETLRERLEIRLAPEAAVTLYNFLPRFLAASEVEMMAVALQDYYARLRDSRLWTLESIQLRPQDRHNNTNGALYLGHAYSQGHRFELYPSAFAAGDYRGVWPCPTLRAVTQHETSHVCVDAALKTLWNRNLNRLGWEQTPMELWLRLPGGLETRLYRRDWEQACTSYAALLPEEDRAECPPCLINQPERLDAVRREFLDTVFSAEPRMLQSPEIHALTPKLPQLNEIVLVRFARPGAGMFVPRGMTAGADVQVIDLDEYRQRRAVA